MTGSIAASRKRPAGRPRPFTSIRSDQVLEERVNGSTSANLQYVWGLRNVNDLVLRDSNNGSGGNLGISGSGLGLRLYALQDANWNVIALVDTSGAVQSGSPTRAYGTATALNPNFTPYSGATNFHWTRLFAGMDADPATGLLYDNVRWYNPEPWDLYHDRSGERGPQHLSLCRRQPDNQLRSIRPNGCSVFGFGIRG